MEEEAYAAYNSYFGIKPQPQLPAPAGPILVYKTPFWKDAILVVVAFSLALFLMYSLF